MRQYEIAVIYHPDLEIDLERASKKVEAIIAQAKGKITKKDNWGKRRLAYKIKRQTWGIYIFYQVELEPAAVHSIEASLRISEEVMRFLIVSLENQRPVNKGKSVKKAKTSATVKNTAVKKSNDSQTQSVDRSGRSADRQAQ